MKSMFLVTALAFAAPALAAPQITNVSPSLSPTQGGVRLTITGTGFGATPGQVAFDDKLVSVPAGDWTNTQVQVDTPEANPGPCVVELRTPGGPSNHWNSFSYDLPRLTSLSPSSGPASPAFAVSIYGENFGVSGIPIVTFGTKTVFGQLVNHQEIRAFPPSLPPGQSVLAHVEVAGGYQSGSLPFQVFGPIVEKFDPIFGPTTGGGLMQINGANFGTDPDDPLPVVRLGNVIATNVVRHEDFVLTCDAPPGAGIGRHLTVQVGSAVSPPSQDAFYFMPPTITSFEPTEAPFTGSTITIHGTNFGPPGTSVLLYAPTMSGSQFIACDEVNQDRAVAHVPYCYPGDYGLFVDVEGQWSDAHPFTFRSFPEILSYGPYGGPSQGGTPMTILGREFGITPGTVHLGPWACAIDTWQNETITCHTPPGYGGEIFPLSVETGAGSSKDWYFTYDSPQLLQVDPMFMDPAGNQVITLRGDNFGIEEAPLYVEFSGQLVPVSNWVSHQEVQVLSPPGVPNQVGLVCVRMGSAGEESCEDYQYGNPVAVDPAPLPVAFALRLVGANPSRGTTAFVVDLPRDARYRLQVFDAAGRLVRRFDADGVAGSPAVSWDGNDEHGGRAAPGLYWARLEVAGERFTRKVMRF